MIVALTGKDTIKINGRILNQLADGDCAVLTFPNDLMNIKTGKSGNSIYAFNYTGQQCELSLRVIRGGADDQYLNNLLALMKNNPALFSLMQGEFDKNVGDGNGNLTVDSYILSGGVFKKNPEVKENADGESEQAVTIYTLIFSNAPRTIN
ncbi:hypothetical protein EKK58_10115 [Candidatus Dependentiae bacterium]|nr:MAG: hypothetical protein EKK58_10115 [Candidatus Dependentiae bacterium]